MILPPWARAGLVVFVALMVQLTVVNEIRIWGVTGSLLVVTPVAAGLVAGPVPGALVGFAAGLLLDAFLTTPFGLTALVWTIVGHAVGVSSRNLIRSSPVAIVGFAAVSAVAAIGAFVVVGYLLGQTHLFAAPLLRIALVGGLVASIAVFAVLPPMRWALTDPHDPVHARR